MKSHRFWVLAVAAAVCLTAIVGVGAAQMGKGRPTALAVVDIEKVFNALNEKVALEAELTSRREGLRKELDTRKKEVESLKGELDILSPSASGYRAQQEKLEQKLYEMQAWGQWQDNMLIRDSRLVMANLYNKILASIGKVAKENGYDMVLYKEPAVDFTGVKPEEVGALIRGRKVLWAADDLDLTTQITQSMNNEYSNNVSVPTTKPAK